MSLLLRLAAAAATALLFAHAAIALPDRAGLSTFGRPPELAVVHALAAVVGLLAMLLARERLELARRLTLVLVVATTLGEAAVPADPALRLVVLGVALVAARPFLRGGPASLVTLLALALAVPSLLGTVFPFGALLWLSFVLPAAALAVLVPALFASCAGRVALTLVAATAALGLAGLASYVGLARGLALPLTALLPTRLHLAGLHPNLAVPAVVAALVLATALAWQRRGAARALALALGLVLATTLAAIGSRTGSLAAAGALALLVLLLVASRWRRALHLALGLGLLASLLFPLSGLTDASVTRRSESMVSKAVSFRTAMWELGRDTFEAAPWHGFGPGTTFVQAALARPGRYDGLPKEDHPHSLLLLTGEALGVPGLLGLAALLLASVWPRARTGALGEACLAALVAVFAADAIDLGGAANTIYPAPIFLLLGLREAATAGARPEPARRSTGRDLVVALLATGALVLGGLLAAERELLRGAREPGVDTLARVELAERLMPLDPRCPFERADLLLEQGEGTAAIEAVREGRRLHPRLADGVHREAAVRARLDPLDPLVRVLLDEALALDGYGPRSAARHLDRACFLAASGDREGTRQALLAALLLDPGAAGSLPRTGEGADIVLLPAGAGGSAVPLRELLAALAEQRVQAEGRDAAVHHRLKMREIDVPAALAAYDEAAAAARVHFAGDPPTALGKVGQLELSRGNWVEAVRLLAEANAAREADGKPPYFWLLAEELRARAEAEPLDGPGFSALEARVLGLLPDVVFEAPSLRTLLEARQRFAERQLDAALAARLSDAVAYAAR